MLLAKISRQSLKVSFPIYPDLGKFNSALPPQPAQLLEVVAGGVQQQVMVPAPLAALVLVLDIVYISNLLTAPTPGGAQLAKEVFYLSARLLSIFRQVLIIVGERGKNILRAKVRGYQQLEPLVIIDQIHSRLSFALHFLFSGAHSRPIPRADGRVYHLHRQRPCRDSFFIFCHASASFSTKEAVALKAVALKIIKNILFQRVWLPLRGAVSRQAD